MGPALVPQGTLSRQGKEEGAERLMRREAGLGDVQSEAAGPHPSSPWPCLPSSLSFLPCQMGPMTTACRVIQRLQRNQVGDTPGTQRAPHQWQLPPEPPLDGRGN